MTVSTVANVATSALRARFVPLVNARLVAPQDNPTAPVAALIFNPTVRTVALVPMPAKLVLYVHQGSAK